MSTMAAAIILGATSIPKSRPIAKSQGGDNSVHTAWDIVPHLDRLFMHLRIGFVACEVACEDKIKPLYVALNFA